MRRAAALLVACAAASLLAACARVPEPPAPMASSFSSAPAASGVAPPDAAAVEFRACPSEPADRGVTLLDPVAEVTDADDVDPDGQPIPHGRVVVSHVADLVLTDGVLAAGNGYEVSTGGLEREGLSTAGGTRTAPVTVALLESGRSGTLVAFVEVLLAEGTPVRWAEEPRLGIITDGGDGGFADGRSSFRGDDGTTDAYLAALSLPGAMECMVRVMPDGSTGAVIVRTGYGDGGYPTFVGYDAQGEPVAAVHMGWVLPWRMSGLPGTPPPGVDDPV